MDEALYTKLKNRESYSIFSILLIIQHNIDISDFFFLKIGILLWKNNILRFTIKKENY